MHAKLRKNMSKRGTLDKEPSSDRIQSSATSLNSSSYSLESGGYTTSSSSLTSQDWSDSRDSFTDLLESESVDETTAKKIKNYILQKLRLKSKQHERHVSTFAFSNRID